MSLIGSLLTAAHSCGRAAVSAAQIFLRRNGGPFLTDGPPYFWIGSQGLGSCCAAIVFLLINAATFLITIGCVGIAASFSTLLEQALERERIPAPVGEERFASAIGDAA